MLALLNPSESLAAVLSAAPTTEPAYFAVWREAGSPSWNQATGSLSDSSATIVPAPIAGAREVDSIRVFNADTAEATVTFSKVVGATSYTLAKVSVPAGGQAAFDAAGVRVVNASGQLLQTIYDDYGVGVAVNGAVATELGTGPIRRTVLALTDVSLTVGNSTGVSFGGTKVYDFPTGRILLLGSIFRNISIDLTDEGNATPIDAADGGDMAMGSTPPDDGTLTDTDVDIVPSTSIDPVSDGIDGAALAASAQFDGTTTALDAYLNMIVDDADVGDGASDVLLVSGEVEMHWVNLGTY
jgi:hypothetical protein